MEPKSGKRRGNLVVCSNCRRKKIKCDKTHPCANCIRSNLTDTCKYEDFTIKHVTVRQQESSDKILKLQKEIESLKNFIASQAVTPEDSPKTATASSSSSSILDMKTGKYCIFSINMKPSRVQVVTAFRPNFTTKCIVEFQSKMAPGKLLKKNEWQEKNTITPSIDSIPSPFQSPSNNVDEKVQSIFVNNYYGVLERLIYFQNELNELIFNSAIPCNVLHTVFNYYVRASMDGIQFIKPKKLHEYQPLALILAIVDLVEIFTKYEHVKPFCQVFQLEPFELSQIACQALGFAKFRQKQTHFGLMALLSLRLTLIHYGHFINSGFTFHNEYSYYQTAVNMAISMGLDRDIDKLEFFMVDKSLNDDETNFAKQIPFDCLKKTWNYLLMQDVHFPLFGPSPMINLEFSNGLYLDVLGSKQYEKSYHPLITSMLKAMLNKQGTPLNVVWDVGNKLQQYCKELLPIGDDVYTISNNKKCWSQILNKLYSLKIIMELFAFAGYQSSECGRATIFSQEQLKNSQNIQDLDIIHEKFKNRATLIYIFTLKFINSVLSTNNHPMFTIYMRNFFWLYLIKPSLGMITLAIEPGKHLKVNEKVMDVSMGELENLLLNDENVGFKDRIRQIVQYYSSPHILELEILKVFKMSFKSL